MGGGFAFVDPDEVAEVSDGKMFGDVESKKAEEKVYAKEPDIDGDTGHEAEH